MAYQALVSRATIRLRFIRGIFTPGFETSSQENPWQGVIQSALVWDYHLLAVGVRGITSGRKCWFFCVPASGFRTNGGRTSGRI